MAKLTLIQECLSSSERSMQRDMRAFIRYALGEINLKECKYLFKQNNCIDYETYQKITDDMFREWLNSIGYDRDDRTTNTDV